MWWDRQSQRHGLEPGTGLASLAFGALVVLCRFLGASHLGAAGRALSHRKLRSSRGFLRALHHEVARVFLPGAESQVAKTTIDLTDSIDVAFEFCIFVGHRAHPVIGSNLMMTHVNTCNMGPNPSWSKEARPLFADRESLDNFLAARAMVAGEASLPWGSGCWMAETVSTDHMPMVAGDILFNWCSRISHMQHPVCFLMDLVVFALWHRMELHNWWLNIYI